MAADSLLPSQQCVAAARICYYNNAAEVLKCDISVIDRKVVDHDI